MLTVVGIILVIWAVHLMYNYIFIDFDGTYREAMKEARSICKSQWITGLSLMIGAYVLTFIPLKK